MSVSIYNYKWLHRLFCTAVASSLGIAPVANAATPAPRKSVTAIPVSKLLPFSKKLDVLIEADLRSHGKRPNARSSDEEFVRRTYLNIVGRIPSYTETTAFLETRSSSKRSALIDQLLDSPGYVSHQFNLWADILRIKTRLPGNNGADNGQPYIDFLKTSLKQNQPYDAFVRDLIAADGPTWKRGNGAVGYYLRDKGMPLDNMANSAQIFLGTQLQCAQCHDHPFDKWTQLDFYKMAAFTEGVSSMRLRSSGALVKKALPRVGRTPSENNLRQANRIVSDALVNGLDHGGAGVIKLPKDYAYDNGKPGQSIKADTLFGADVALTFGPQPKKAKRGKQPPSKDIGSRAAYADWITSHDTPRFNTVIANRLWRQAMGRALIEPLDEITDKTVASNPALMKQLEALIEITRYDMKQFLRVVYNTQTYQRQATREDTLATDVYRFQGPLLRRMSGEQVWDSLLTLTLNNVDQPAPVNPRRTYYSQYDIYSKMSAPQITAEAKMLATTYKAKYDDDKGSLSKLIAIQAEKYKFDSKDLAANEKFAAEKSAMKQKMAAAKRKKDWKEVKKLSAQFNRKGYARGRVSNKYRRAADLTSPAPAGHLVRMFGASDREQIENNNQDAVVTQVLSLINGYVENDLIGRGTSELTARMKAAATSNDKLDVAFLSMLNRKPTRTESSTWLRVLKAGGENGYKDLVWTLSNSHEFIFIQ